MRSISLLHTTPLLVVSRGTARLRTAALLCGLLTLYTACDRADPEPEPPPLLPADPAFEVTPVRFDTANIVIRTATRTVPLRVEVAERSDQRAYGLMDREQLGADEGMIFLYDDVQGGDSGFWMYRTRVPLDIAYFDGVGRIVAIQQMLPCPSADPARCPYYSAGAPYLGGLEVNRGFFTQHGIAVGDRIEMPGRLGE